MKWLPNPYAIAQQLAGVPDITLIMRAGGQAADNFLFDTFLSSRRQKTMTGAVAVFQRIADLFNSPMTLSQAIDKSKEIWAEEGYTVDEIARVLPSLVQIADALSSNTFTDSDDLIVGKVSYVDPVQGSVGDCYLISAMIALAWAETDKLTARLNSSGFDPPTQRSFEWQFHDQDGEESDRIEVTGRIMTLGSIPRYARSRSRAEDWPSLVEKAYVVQTSGADAAEGEPTQPHYQSIDAMKEGRMPQDACQALLGGLVSGEVLHTDEGPTEAGRKIFLHGGRLETPSGVMSKPVMAWTKNKEDMEETNPDVWKATGLWPRHAYAVLGAMLSNNTVKHVVLRNPHGADTDPETRGYHPGPWEPDGRPAVPLNKDGVFAVPRKAFFDNFEDMGWIDFE